MSPHREEGGLATVETTLMVVILVPLLFGVIEFGSLFQRWLAAETVVAHAARYAGELGGDEAALRSYIASELAGVGIDARSIPRVWDGGSRSASRSTPTSASICRSSSRPW